MRPAKRPAGKPAEATCATCPAWCRIINDDGSDQPIPRIGPDDQPVLFNGERQFVRDAAGGFVIQGTCRPGPPQLLVTPRGPVTGYPVVRSDWWCLQHPQRRRG
jgi:hypothetical protein